MRFRVRYVRSGRECLRYFATQAEAEWEKYLQDKHWPERRAVVEHRIGDVWYDCLPDMRSAFARGRLVGARQ